MQTINLKGNLFFDGFFSISLKYCLSCLVGFGSSHSTVQKAEAEADSQLVVRKKKSHVRDDLKVRGGGIYEVTLAPRSMLQCHYCYWWRADS